MLFYFMQFGHFAHIYLGIKATAHTEVFIWVSVHCVFSVPQKVSIPSAQLLSHQCLGCLLNHHPADNVFPQCHQAQVRIIIEHFALHNFTANSL